MMSERCYAASAHAEALRCRTRSAARDAPAPPRVAARVQRSHARELRDDERARAHGAPCAR